MTVSAPHLVIIFAIQLLNAAALGVELYRHPEHHVGYDPRYFAVLPLISLLFAAAGSMTKFTRLRPLIALLSILQIATVYYIYQYSILLPYHEWIKRGMP